MILLDHACRHESGEKVGGEQPSYFERTATGGQMKRAEMSDTPLQDGAAGAFGKLRGRVLAEKAQYRKKQGPLLPGHIATLR